MKMSFIPGKLELCSKDDVFIVSIEGQEVCRTRSRAAAVRRFNEIRLEMEQRYPPSGPSAEDAKALLQRMLTDVAIDETLRRPRKKRSTARSSRTFGG